MMVRDWYDTVDGGSSWYAVHQPWAMVPARDGVLMQCFAVVVFEKPCAYIV